MASYGRQESRQSSFLRICEYGSDTGVFSIDDLMLRDGYLPRRVISLMLEWAFEHREELMADWNRAAEKKPLLPIPPLD